MPANVHVSINQLSPQATAEALNKKYGNQSWSLSDFNKEIKRSRVLDISERVLSIIGAGIAFSINPFPTIVGGVIAALSIRNNPQMYFDHSPKFTVHDSRVFQVNDEFQKELKSQQKFFLGSMLLTSIAAGSLFAGFKSDFGFRAVFLGHVGILSAYRVARDLI